MPIAESPLVPELHASSPPGASSAKWEQLLSLNVVWEGWFSVSSTFLGITAFWQQRRKSAKRGVPREKPILIGRIPVHSRHISF
jgi:hypothetical protein